MGDLRSDRLGVYIASFAKNARRPRMDHYPGLPSRPWHDGSQLPIVVALEDRFRDIRDEVSALPASAFHREGEAIARDGAWDVLMFYELGYKNTANCSLCPVITDVVRSHASVRSLAGLIYVSRMKPGTHIAAHCGPTNMRLRCHLALRVPAGDCAICVDGERRGWEEGRCLVFDDQFEHEAWNRTSEERIVLVVDIWHPDLSRHEIAVLEGLHRYAAVHADILGRYWAMNAAARASARH